jgi:hypothetical protein
MIKSTLIVTTKVTNILFFGGGILIFAVGGWGGVETQRSRGAEGAERGAAEEERGGGDLVNFAHS